MRRTTAFVGGGALLIGLALFYLLGGRSLVRHHRRVVRRATRDPLTDLGNHRESGRREDRVFRIGGDEFALLMTATDGDGARTALDRRRAVAREAGMATSFTAGIAVMAPRADSDPHVLWEQADAALYEGKRKGGDTWSCSTTWPSFSRSSRPRR